MSDPARPQPQGGGYISAALFGGIATFFGLLVGLPYLLGPAVGLGSVLLSAGLRRLPLRRVGDMSLLPAALGLAVLMLAAPPNASTDLFAGITVMAFLLWIADDPARPRGGGRRAVASLGLVGIGFALAWGLVAEIPHGPPNIGLSAGLVAALLIALAWVLSRGLASADRPQSA